MEERSRRAGVTLKAAQQEVFALKANAQQVAGFRKEIATLEHNLMQVYF